MLSRFFVFCFVALLSSALTVSAATELPAVQPNENRRAAGAVVDGTQIVTLRAAAGLWRPEGETGPAVRIEAFGEEGAALVVPSPLVRVRAGQAIAITVRNDLEATLTVHGLCARPAEKCAPLNVPPADQRSVRFTIDLPGTYHYWATTTGMPLTFRGTADTQLSGALIVDPALGEIADDRVLVITDWTSLTREQLKSIAAADDPGIAFERLDPRLVFLVNGLSWPATERMTYRLGEQVRWQVVNLSSQRHPMHMHGFYYRIDGVGDGVHHTTYADDQKPQVVTHLMQPGATMAMTWTPERVGNWLFHCHVMHHVSPDRTIEPRAGTHAGHHDAADPGKGMAGLVLGVTVVSPETAPVEPTDPVPPRKLTLTMTPIENRNGGPIAGAGFLLQEAGVPSPADRPSVPSVPGPMLVLERGEPVEITLVNRLAEGTAIHWHGMELDSYYDGVHGWSGAGTKVTPLIEPGKTFVVRFTPPRTGTFIYHTHLHDNRQLPSGLYGALLVVEPNASRAAYDLSVDHVFVIGSAAGAPRAPVVLNGERQPQFVWKAGARHRVRLINITTDDIFAVTLQSQEGPVTWRPLTKDGAPLPPNRCVPGPARLTIAVGETYDFEVEAPPGRQNLWLEVRSTGGKWQVQGQIVVK